MDSKDRSDKGAGPKGSGSRVQQRKQQQHHGRMQQHVDQMVPCRIESEQLAIQHVRNRCQRMPISRVRFSECRNDAARRYTRGDPWIVINISLVVVGDEIMTESLSKYDPGKSGEYQIYRQYRIWRTDRRMEGT